jgi:hypothetical protein
VYIEEYLGEFNELLESTTCSEPSPVSRNFDVNEDVSETVEMKHSSSSSIVITGICLEIWLEPAQKE